MILDDLATKPAKKRKPRASGDDPYARILTRLAEG